MVSEEMYVLGTKKSTIRTIFEFGQKRAAEVGAENVFDFSLGNPNVPVPDFIRDAAVDILMHGDPTEVHGYTIAPGKPAVREVLAADLKHRFGMEVTGKNLFMTAGAAASVTITFKALTEPGDEFVTFAPFFPEYRVFVEACGGKLVVVTAKTDDFQIDLTALERVLTPQTKAVIVNSPNNPSGAVYRETTIRRLTDLLRAKEQEYGHPIFIVADEPYREIVYDGLTALGFSCVRPQGAFYLFPQALEPDDAAFCRRAQEYDLLLVPGRDFGCPGYFRAAYCVRTKMIEKSLPRFEELAKSYKSISE